MTCVQQKKLGEEKMRETWKESNDKINIATTTIVNTVHKAQKQVTQDIKSIKSFYQ